MYIQSCVYVQYYAKNNHYTVQKLETEVTVYDKYVSQILFLSFSFVAGGHPFHQRPNLCTFKEPRNRLQGIDSARLGIDSSAL